MITHDTGLIFLLAATVAVMLLRPFVAVARHGGKAMDRHHRPRPHNKKSSGSRRALKFKNNLSV